MFRHLVRHIVKPGEFAEFVDAFKEFADAAPNAGLPAYRLWRTLFGDLNEAWAEAEFESLDAHLAAWTRASEKEDFMRSFRAMVSHTVPATVRDYPLEPLLPSPDAEQ